MPRTGPRRGRARTRAALDRAVRLLHQIRDDFEARGPDPNLNPGLVDLRTQGGTPFSLLVVEPCSLEAEVHVLVDRLPVADRIKTKVFRRAVALAEWGLLHDTRYLVCATFAVERAWLLDELKLHLGTPAGTAWRAGRAVEDVEAEAPYADVEMEAYRPAYDDMGDRQTPTLEALRRRANKAMQTALIVEVEGLRPPFHPTREGDPIRTEPEVAVLVAELLHHRVPVVSNILLVEGGLGATAQVLSASLPLATVRCVNSSAGHGRRYYPGPKPDAVVINLPDFRSWTLATRAGSEDARWHHLDKVFRDHVGQDDQARCVRTILDLAEPLIVAGRPVVLLADKNSGAHALAVQYIEDRDLVAPVAVRGLKDGRPILVRNTSRRPGYFRHRVPDPTDRLVSMWVARSISRLGAPTGNQVGVALAVSTGGDPLATRVNRLGVHHGHPEFVDSTETTKLEVYDAVHGDIESRIAFADELNRKTRKGSIFPDGLRVFVKKKDSTKRRPIDVPPEAKRPYALLDARRLQGVVAEVNYIPDTIIGFRSAGDIPEWAGSPPKGRGQQATIQDQFASCVHGVACRYGPWAVGVDLTNAYGLLTREAVYAATKDLGLCRGDRRRAWNIAKVRSRTKSGKSIRHRDYGVEQGNAVSQILLNLVVTYLYRRMRGRGSKVVLCSYGDDLVIVGPTEDKVIEAFNILVEEARAVGMTNIRPIDSDDPKSSKVYDLRDPRQAIPLIKTYTVDVVRGIGLMNSKMKNIENAIPLKKRNAKTIRAEAGSAVISKKWMKASGLISNINKTPKRGDPQDPDDDLKSTEGAASVAGGRAVGPADVGPTEPSLPRASRRRASQPEVEGDLHVDERSQGVPHPQEEHHRVDVDTRTRGPKGDDQEHGGHDRGTDLLQDTPTTCDLDLDLLDEDDDDDHVVVVVHQTDSGSTPIAPASTPPSQEGVGDLDSGEGEPRATPGAGVTPGGAGVAGLDLANWSPATPGPVLHPPHGVIDLLGRSGRRAVKVGNAWKGHAVDLRTVTARREDVRHRVARGLVELVRVRRVAWVLVDPTDPATELLLAEALADHLVRRRLPHHLGELVKLVVPAATPEVHQPKPPDADVVLVKARRLVQGRRWEVTALVRGRRKLHRVDVRTESTVPARAQAAAAVADLHAGASIGVPRAWFAGVLGEKRLPRDTGRFIAARMLGDSWEAGGDWWVRRRSSDES